jgi:hypothetical protein
VTLDLFAATQARDEAIETADASVSTSLGGDELVGRVTERLCRAYPVGTRFTADVLALYLDDAGVARDQSTRRRIVSTIISRGRNKLWTMQGYTVSEDPRRKARPVALWERV